MRVLSEPRKVTSSGKVIQLCPTLASRERDPVAGGCGFASRPPDRTPGRHFTRAFCINGGSGGASKLILKDSCRKPKTSMEVKFTTYFPILRTLLVKYVIDTISN
jgi:hypothetical protein